MKLIHCGDVHLDSRMESNLPREKARERSAEICATFTRMIRYGMDHGVRAVLIAGDFFDTPRVSTQTVQFLLDRMEEAREMDFLYLRGNHDEGLNLFEGMEMPENFKTFRDGWCSYRYEDVVISGVEPEDWETYDEGLELNSEDTNIVMLHGQVSTQTGRELICLPKLRNQHIRYLALGHIHGHQKDQLDLDGQWCYCGCLEGRGFDELGQKGFVMLEVENGCVKPEFIPFGTRTMEEVTVDITGLTTVTQILSAMERAGSGIPASSLVKFVFAGTHTLDTQLDFRFLEKMLESRYYFVKIKDESRLEIAREDYEHDISLKGEFIRMVLASDKTEEEKERIIRFGIQALLGQEVEA